MAPVLKDFPRFTQVRNTEDSNKAQWLAEIKDQGAVFVFSLQCTESLNVLCVPECFGGGK